MFNLFKKFHLRLSLDELFVVIHALSAYNLHLCNEYNDLLKKIGDFPDDSYVRLFQYNSDQFDRSIVLLLKLQKIIDFYGVKEDEN